ncbi:hypothetical protein BDV96DRAFT_492255, partial [Lophiotrema nucula]
MSTRSRGTSAYSEFLRHIKKSEISSDNPSSTSPNRPFIPYPALSAYLMNDQIRGLLDYCAQSTVDCATIRQGYLLVFAIILSINQGAYLPYFLQSDELADEHLPFTHSQNWPEPCTQIFEQFFKAQWRFCAFKLRKSRLNDTQIQDECIVPIVKKVGLKDGGISSTYRVDIHPAYNLLFHRQDEAESSPTSTFVLKTCHETHSTYHHNEVHAYKALNNHGGPLNNIVVFHGSWISHGTYNMLLEYVDGGTLTEFLKSTEPPTRVEDIVDFWSSLLDLIKPLIRMHNLETVSSTQQSLQCIHNDIKPDNVLVSPGRTSYQPVFKLADMGLTTLEEKKNVKDASSRDAQGTSMYSSPECFRIGTFLEESLLKEKPSKDIYALGCVYSEAAVWTVLGTKGLEDYRVLRTQETDNIPGLRRTAYSGCFHNGSETLGAVGTMHIRIREERRRHDLIIEPVLEIIEYMLEQEAFRPNAAEIQRRIERAIQTARSRLRQGALEVNDQSFPEAFRISSELSSPRMLPELLPSGVGLGVDYHPSRRHSRSISQMLVDAKSTDLERDWYSYANTASDIARSSRIHHTHQVNDDASQERFEGIEGGSSWDKDPQNIQDKAPNLSIDELLQWIDDKKMRKPRSVLASAELLNRLDERDQIFLIDDSASMSPHWEAVKKAFTALVYLAKFYGPDEIELQFANCRKSSCDQHRKKSLKVLNGVKPQGQCNMALALQHILERYHPEALGNCGKHRIFRKRKKKSGVNITVLTDAASWKDGKDGICGVSTPIKDILEKYNEHRIATNRIAIQFVQFGNDLKGSEMLERLTTRPEEFGIAGGIVDTTPNSGNVSKMLLGAFDPAWNLK